ncbi:MAG: hypothetical protein ACSHXY_02300 [Alphaproteobacteria bacterium]
MNFTSFPDLLGFSQRTRSTTLLKARLDTVSQEAVTGIQADLTKASGGRVGDLHLLQKALDDISLETKINSLASSRVNLITQGITGARSAFSGVDTNAIIALSTGGASALQTVSEEAAVSLKNAMDSLSIQHGTRNLFSGDATNIAPFAGSDELIDDVKQILSTAPTSADAEAALDFYFNDPSGGFNTNIYQGGSGDASSIRLGNNSSIPMNIRGDNDAIKEALRGLSVMAASTQAGMDLESDKFSEIFSSGITATSNGSSQLISLEASIGIYAQSIETLNERNQAEEQTITSAYQAIASRDQFEAASELKQLEVALESSYIITSRLADLSLVNYLR